MEEGDMASFFYMYNGLGLSLGAKLVSTNDRPSKFSIIAGLFQAGVKKKLCRIFARLHEPVGGTRMHVCRFFRAKNRRSALRIP